MEIKDVKLASNDNISGVKNTSNEYKFKRSFYFDVECSANGREVDCVNFADCEAIEISVKNKSGKDLCFDDLPEIFTKTLLTKDQDFTEANGVVRIPYYKFIFEHSVGKELLPKVEV